AITGPAGGNAARTGPTGGSTAVTGLAGGRAAAGGSVEATSGPAVSGSPASLREAACAARGDAAVRLRTRPAEPPSISTPATTNFMPRPLEALSAVCVSSVKLILHLPA